jgi:hypothetical protein
MSSDAMHIEHGEIFNIHFAWLKDRQLSNKQLSKFTNQVAVNTIMVDEASQIEIGLLSIFNDICNTDAV